MISSVHETFRAPDFLAPSYFIFFIDNVPCVSQYLECGTRKTAHAGIAETHRASAMKSLRRDRMATKKKAAKKKKKK
jgi:hypothetical protein